MKKHLPIYVYGATIIFSGIFLLLSTTSSLNLIKFTLGITLSVGAIFAFIAALARPRRHVQFAYHEMHALAMLVYGVIIMVFNNTFENIVSLTSYLFIFYAFSEIIFCIWIFNLALKIVYKIVMVRMLLGIAVGIGTIAVMNYPEFVLEAFGVFFILVGINILLYVPIVKGRETNLEPSKAL